LFILNRYICPPFLFIEGFSSVRFDTGVKMCQAKRYTNFPTFVFIMTVELMLILRVLALYGHSKKMARLLLSAYAFQFVVWSVIGIVIMRQTRGIPGGHLFSGCLYQGPKYNFIGWLPGLLFEVLLIGLTIHKCLKFRLGEFPPSIQVLVRDSVIYFVVITAILTFNTFYTIFGERLLGPSLVLPSGVVTSIAAARLTMNIRRFTMDQGMAALGETIHSRMILRTNGEDRRNIEPGTIYGTTLPLHGRPDDGLDDEEDLKSPRVLLTPPSPRTSSRYLVAGLSVS